MDPNAKEFKTPEKQLSRDEKLNVIIPKGPLNN